MNLDLENNSKDEEANNDISFHLAAQKGKIEKK